MNVLLLHIIYIYLLYLAIVDLMSYLRETWSKVSITPKLHMMEEHATTFMKVGMSGHFRNNLVHVR